MPCFSAIAKICSAVTPSPLAVTLGAFLPTTLPQYLLPHHPLSRLMRQLTHSENKTWKNFFIKQIVNHYGVNMEEAIDSDINAYQINGVLN
jgi:hypothetical protein